LETVTSEKTLIPGPCREVELSPDGLSVAYVFEDDQKSVKHLRIYSVADRSAYTVSTDERSFIGPRWSADGKLVFYEELFSKRQFAVDANTGTVDVIGEGNGKDNREFWRSEVGWENIHFNQTVGFRGWRQRRSPGGLRSVEVDEGSLYLIDYEVHDRSLLLENTGCRLGTHGIAGAFHNPTWTASEEYVVGTLAGNIVVVDVRTGRSGILVGGRDPLSHIPGYRRDEADVGSSLMFD